MASEAPLPVQVYVLAGDDAAVGYALANELRIFLIDSDPNVREKYKHLMDLKHHGEQFKTWDNVFCTYNRDMKDWETGPLTVGKFSASHARFGPEVEMGHVLSTSFPRQPPIVLVKAAWSNKTLAKDFLPPSSDVGEEPKYGGAAYQQIVESVNRTIRSLDDVLQGGDALAYHQAHGHVLAGLVWFHGYSDLELDDSPYGMHIYETNLRNLLGDLRSDLSPFFHNDQDFLMAVAELGGRGKHVRLQGNETKSPEVMFREMQQRVVQNMALSTDSLAVYVETAQFANDPHHHGDNVATYVHYFGQADTMISIGGAFAKAFLDTIYQDELAGSSLDKNVATAQAAAPPQSRRVDPITIFLAIAFAVSSLVLALTVWRRYGRRLRSGGESFDHTRNAGVEFHANDLELEENYDQTRSDSPPPIRGVPS